MWGGAFKKGSGGKLEGKCGVRALGTRKGTLPPFETLEAPFQAPFKPPSSPLQAPFKALKPLKPPSSASKPFEAPSKAWEALEAPFEGFDPSTLRPPPGGRESVASVGGF